MAGASQAENEALAQFSCLYFGFASNLSPRNLQQRCPGALHVGVGVLRGWKFIVSEVGFGNIVPGARHDMVYGNVAFLTRQHEEALDQSEEVPHWHQKRKLKIRMVIPNGREDGWQDGEEVEATCYIDVDHVSEGNISKEYIVWLRKAIADGLALGIPSQYFEQYMSKFLPEDEGVGREDRIIMLRTIQQDKEDLQNVPTWLLQRGKE